MVIHFMDSGLTKREVRNLLSAEGRGAKRGKPETLRETIDPRVRGAALAILDAYPLDEFASRSGHQLAESGNWLAAARAFARACELAPDDFKHWYFQALCALKAGRRDEYADICRQMIGQFPANQHDRIRFYVLDTLLLNPVLPLGDLEAFSAQIDRRFLLGHYGRPGRAQMAVRHGNFANAEELLQGSPPIGLDPIRWCYLKALVQAKLGMSDARESFAQAEALSAAATRHWSMRAYHELLRDEAREAIERHLKPDAASNVNSEGSSHDRGVAEPKT
jgi:Flp pilus assembly protein TadD